MTNYQPYRGWTALFIVLLLLCTGQIWRDKRSQKNAEGNARYLEKNYTGALEKYVEAQDVKKPRPEISYNMANTLYRQQKYQEAIKEYEKSASNQSSSLNEKTFYNLGNSFFRMGRYQDAIESYQKALDLDPKDRDAKYNLELAWKKLQENPQQQKPGSSGEKQGQQQKGDSSKDNQQGKESASRSPEKANPSSEKKESMNPQPERAQQSRAGLEQQKKDMNAQEALQILDAINELERKEQRRQALRVQRGQATGRDW